jgi:hypothetical protein
MYMYRYFRSIIFHSINAFFGSFFSGPTIYRKNKSCCPSLRCCLLCNNPIFSVLFCALCHSVLETIFFIFVLCTIVPCTVMLLLLPNASKFVLYISYFFILFLAFQETYLVMTYCVREIPLLTALQFSFIHQTVIEKLH